MTHATTQRRRRMLVFALVGLVALLGAGPQLASARRDQPFHARLVTINQPPVPCGATSICLALHGSGYAALLGRVTEVGQVAIDLASQPGPDPACHNNVRNVLLTAANGDQLTLLVTGVSCDTGATTGITGISHDTWIVVDGTGRFRGATGSGADTVTVRIAESTAWTVFTGTISLRELGRPKPGR